VGDFYCKRISQEGSTNRTFECPQSTFADMKHMPSRAQSSSLSTSLDDMFARWEVSDVLADSLEHENRSLPLEENQQCLSWVEV
jgi:hypothetical protein